MKCSEALRRRIDELCKKYNLTYSSLSNKSLRQQHDFFLYV